jgi:hypothetical protein
MFAIFLCYLVHRPSSWPIPPSKKPYEFHEGFVFSVVNPEFEQVRTPKSLKLLKKAALNIVFVD